MERSALHRKIKSLEINPLDNESGIDENKYAESSKNSLKKTG